MPKKLHKNICEEKLFNALFKKHFQDLNNFLYYKFGELLNPQDKTQEAYIKLWENCKKVTPEKAKSFLFTIANNLMLNEVKHQKVVLKYQQTKQTHHTNETPEFVLEEKQYMDKLQNALAKLSDVQRTAFLMNRIEGKKRKEIAELLNVSIKTVEKRLYGAIKILREDIKGL